MSYPDRVSVEEQAYDFASHLALRSQVALAKEQLTQVNSLADEILKGFPVNAVRKCRQFKKETNSWVFEDMVVNFDLPKVVGLVSENLTVELCLDFLSSSPSSMARMQKLIREAAKEIAFDALDLESNPFLDLRDLREMAEE